MAAGLEVKELENFAPIRGAPSGVQLGVENSIAEVKLLVGRLPGIWIGLWRMMEKVPGIAEYIKRRAMVRRSRGTMGGAGTFPARGV